MWCICVKPHCPHLVEDAYTSCQISVCSDHATHQWKDWELLAFALLHLSSPMCLSCHWDQRVNYCRLTQKPSLPSDKCTWCWIRILDQKDGGPTMHCMYLHLSVSIFVWMSASLALPAKFLQLRLAALDGLRLRLPLTLVLLQCRLEMDIFHLFNLSFIFLGRPLKWYWVFGKAIRVSRDC